MTTTTASKLDTTRFRKVHSLMTGGATEGERSAALARAKAMAARAGMTLPQAVSNLDKERDPQPAPKVFDFEAMWAEAKEAECPGWTVREAGRRAQQAEIDARRRAEILHRYGSEEALFARTEREALLDAAIKPIAKWGYWTDDHGKRHRYAKALDGRKPKHNFWSVREITPAIRQAVVGAYPWPANIGEAFDEVRSWDALESDRDLFCGAGSWSHYAEVECRIQLLQHDLATEFPAASWDDVQTRFDWFGYREKWSLPTSPEMMARLQSDFAALRQRYGEAAPATPSAPRTNAEKRAAVLSMLDDHPEMSDREIARRLGVSPQTVNSWRNRE